MSPQSHWLTRPHTIRRLWIVFIVLLMATLLSDFIIQGHGHFGIDSIFGFSAWYGFVTCIAMIVFSKLLGIVLQRKDTYYHE